jgi:hypothetical protein
MRRFQSFVLSKAGEVSLMSHSKLKDDKYNPNNIVCMSRNLHQQFDGINSSESIPMFYLSSVRHNPESIADVVDS